MVNINVQIEHWRTTSFEELEVTRTLLDKRHVRQGLFWAHLTLEKMLKAHVCKSTQDLAPRIHNLVRLAELAGLAFPEEDLRFLGKMNDFNLEGRYGEPLKATPSIEKANSLFQCTEEMIAWLEAKL